MTTPSSASRPLPAALSEITALLEDYITAFACWASTESEFSRDLIGADLLDQAEAERDAARASLDAALRGMLDDAEDNRNAQSLALITVMEHHGKHAGEMAAALLDCAAQLRSELQERRAARAARPEASADA